MVVRFGLWAHLAIAFNGRVIYNDCIQRSLKHFWMSQSCDKCCTIVRRRSYKKSDYSEKWQIIQCFADSRTPLLPTALYFCFHWLWWHCKPTLSASTKNIFYCSDDEKKKSMCASYETWIPCLLRFHPKREKSSCYTVSLFTFELSEKQAKCVFCDAFVFISIYSTKSIRLINRSYFNSSIWKQTGDRNSMMLESRVLAKKLISYLITVLCQVEQFMCSIANASFHFSFQYQTFV